MGHFVDRFANHFVNMAMVGLLLAYLEVQVALRLAYYTAIVVMAGMVLLPYTDVVGFHHTFFVGDKVFVFAGHIQIYRLEFAIVCR